MKTYFEKFGRTEQTEFYYNEEVFCFNGVKDAGTFTKLAGFLIYSINKIYRLLKDIEDTEVKNNYLTEDNVRDLYSLMEQNKFKQEILGNG